MNETRDNDESTSINQAPQNPDAIDILLAIILESNYKIGSYTWLRKAQKQGVAASDFVYAVKMLEAVHIVEHVGNGFYKS